MIVLDTNLLLRYLLNDDAAQARRVQHLLETSAQITITTVSYTHLDVYKRQPSIKAGLMPSARAKPGSPGTLTARAGAPGCPLQNQSWN